MSSVELPAKGKACLALATVYRERATGRLSLTVGEETHAVVLRQGLPLSIEQPTPLDPLGSVLLSLGAIDQAAFHTSLVRMAEERKQQGQVLLEMGVIDQATLERGLEAQQRRKLGRLCRLGEARLAFAAGPVVGEALPVHPLDGILSGVRENATDDEVAAQLAEWMTGHVRVAPQSVRQMASLDEQERSFLRQLGQPRRLDELLAGTDLPARQARLLLAVLAVTGELQRATPRPATTPPCSPADRAPDAELSALREEIARRLAALDDQDFFALLDLDPQRPPTPGAVDKAFLRQAGRFHPDRVSHPALSDLQADAQRIFAGLNEAKEILGDPARCQSYLERRARGAEDLGEVGEQKAGRARLLEMEGDVAYRRGDWETAARKFSAAGKLEPSAKRLARSAWSLWARDSKTPQRAAARAQATDLLTQARELDDAYAETYRLLGRVCKLDGRSEEALDWFRQAAALDPHDREAASEVHHAERRARANPSPTGPQRWFKRKG